MIDVSSIIRIELLMRGPGTPTELIRRVKQFSLNKISLSRGGTYTRIKQLERDGLIKVSKVYHGVRSRNSESKEYALTRYGIEQTSQELNSFRKFCGI